MLWSYPSNRSHTLCNHHPSQCDSQRKKHTRTTGSKARTHVHSGCTVIRKALNVVELHHIATTFGSEPTGSPETVAQPLDRPSFSRQRSLRKCKMLQGMLCEPQETKVDNCARHLATWKTYFVNSSCWTPGPWSLKVGQDVDQLKTIILSICFQKKINNILCRFDKQSNSMQFKYQLRDCHDKCIFASHGILLHFYAIHALQYRIIQNICIYMYILEIWNLTSWKWSFVQDFLANGKSSIWKWASHKPFLSCGLFMRTFRDLIYDNLWPFWFRPLAYGALWSSGLIECSIELLIYETLYEHILLMSCCAVTSLTLTSWFRFIERILWVQEFLIHYLAFDVSKRN